MYYVGCCSTALLFREREILLEEPVCLDGRGNKREWRTVVVIKSSSSPSAPNADWLCHGKLTPCCRCSTPPEVQVAARLEPLLGCGGVTEYSLFKSRASCVCEGRENSWIHYQANVSTSFIVNSNLVLVSGRLRKTLRTRLFG